MPSMWRHYYDIQPFDLFLTPLFDFFMLEQSWKFFESRISSCTTKWPREPLHTQLTDLWSLKLSPPPFLGEKKLEIIDTNHFYYHFPFFCCFSFLFSILIFRLRSSNILAAEIRVNIYWVMISFPFKIAASHFPSRKKWSLWK